MWFSFYALLPIIQIFTFERQLAVFTGAGFIIERGRGEGGGYNFRSFDSVSW